MPEKDIYKLREIWKHTKSDFKKSGVYLHEKIYFDIRAEDFLKVFDKSERILHIACGTGKWSIPFLKKGKKVYHLEISKDTLELARKVVSPFKVYSILGDAFYLPFKNEVFDAVISFGFLEHFDDVEMLIREMKRVLRKGGILFADIASGKTFITKIERWVNFFLYLIYAFIKFDFKKIRNSIWFIRRNYYENNYSPFYYMKLMSKYGFKGIKVRAVRIFPLIKLPFFLTKFFEPFLLRAKFLFIPPSSLQREFLLRSAVWEIRGIKG